MKTNLIYATSNPGKIIEISRHFGFHNIPVKSLADFSPTKLDPEETGTTLGQNADIKALAYARAIAEVSACRGSRFCVISDDTGVFIDGLAGEPGIKVRRWKDGKTKMTDKEIIDYTMERLQGLVGDQRTATFRTVLSLVTVDENGIVGPPIHFEGSLKGHIVEKADPREIEGFPFESLFYADEYHMILGDLHRLPEAQKRQGFFNHRERAIEKAIPVIRGLME